jgi:(p)ppGpp synthase/HD superfamily hydrolase
MKYLLKERIKSMSLDREPIKISYALKVAKQYYTKDKYDHAMRVADYIVENEIIPYEYQDECVALAFMHDLIEDTEYTGSGLPENFYKALKLLTKPEEQDYIEYIKNIKDTGHTNWRMCAYWVKLADMKDHLSQTETLTDRLKEKYLKALPYLL